MCCKKQKMLIEEISFRVFPFEKSRQTIETLVLLMQVSQSFDWHKQHSQDPIHFEFAYENTEDCYLSTKYSLEIQNTSHMCKQNVLVVESTCLDFPHAHLSDKE